MCEFSSQIWLDLIVSYWELLAEVYMVQHTIIYTNGSETSIVCGLFYVFTGLSREYTFAAGDLDLSNRFVEQIWEEMYSLRHACAWFYYIKHYRSHTRYTIRAVAFAYYVDMVIGVYGWFACIDLNCPCSRRDWAMLKFIVERPICLLNVLFYA